MKYKTNVIKKWSWLIVFAEFLTDEMHLGLFPAWSVIKDSHQHKSPNLRLATCRIWNCIEPEFKQSKWICAVLTTTKPRFHLKAWMKSISMWWRTPCTKNIENQNHNDNLIYSVSKKSTRVLLPSNSFLKVCFPDLIW